MADDSEQVRDSATAALARELSGIETADQYEEHRLRTKLGDESE